MENKELQLELAKHIWELSKGDPNSCLHGFDFSSEEKLQMEYLLEKGVLKKSNSCYFVCSTTREFIVNNGKTNLELEKEREEQRAEETLKLAKEANKTSKISMWISGIAFIASVLSLA